MTNVLTEIHDGINEGVQAVKGWIGELEGKLPAVVELAQKYEASPIVQALEGAVLPPNVEAEIAKLIQEASNAFGQHGSASVTGAVTVQDTPTTTADPSTPAA